MGCRDLFLASGIAFGACLAGAAEPKVVTLPPFVVEEATAPLPWRHAEVGDIEVLSSCPDRLTRTLVGNHHRLHVLLGELLPPALQLRMSEQRTLLLVDAAHQPASSQEVVAHMALSAVDQEALDQATVPLDDGRLRRRPPPPRYTFLPNLRLWDRDGSALFAVVRESEFDPNRVGLTPEYVAYLLRQRLPALPPWFISGVLSLHARVRFTEDSLVIEPLDWLSEEGSAALLSGKVANRPLLPLADFFAGELAPAAAGEGLSLWQAQAALFIRWGLAGRDSPRRAALWQFAARAAVEPVTEALFRECFGLDFATAHRQLTDYLPEGMRDRLVLRPAQWPRVPEYTLRPAAEADVARIKGDWERLEVGFVKAQFPALTRKYLEQARRTLRQAYDRGSRDPRLLAALGLCEVDGGDDAAAREFLEDAAARSPLLRPRARFELARLRLAALRAAADAPPLTRSQLAPVLAPLLATREQEPPLVEVYVLLAEAWAASSEPPARDDLAVLESGVRLFPHHSDLVYRTAELNVRHGFPESARWLITLGLTLAADPAGRARFEALQARAAAAK